MIGSIIMWLVVGFLAGLLAKAIVPGASKEPSGFLGTAVLGIVGAIVGGFIYYLVSGSAAFRTGFDLPSILWAALGAVVVVFIERGHCWTPRDLVSVVLPKACDCQLTITGFFVVISVFTFRLPILLVVNM